MAVTLAAADAEALLSMLLGYGLGGTSAAAKLSAVLGGSSGRSPITGVADEILARQPMPNTAVEDGGNGSSVANVGALVGAKDILGVVHKAGAVSEYPHPLHTVNVNKVAPGVHNSGIDYNVAKEASRMQTLDEHNKALTAFIRPGMNQAQLADAIVKGKQLEQNLLPFWDDSKPRKEYHPTSSAVQAIRLTPDGRIQVMWRAKPNKKGETKAPKWYSYKIHKDPQEASMAMRRLMTSGSLGRSVLPGRGWFAESEYDGAQATGHGGVAREIKKPGSGYGRRMPYKIRRRK